MIEAPKVSIAIGRAAIPRAIEVAQGSIVWGVWGVVVEIGGRLVLQLEALTAARCLWVKAHTDDAAWLPVGEGASWIAIPAKLLGGSIHLIEKPDVYLAADCRI